MDRDSQTRSYEFGSAAEDDTLLAGLHANQLAILTSGLTAAVVLIRGWPTSGGFAAGAVALAGAVACAFWQAGGRTPIEWMPIVARRSWRCATRRTTRLSQLPLLGETPAGRPNRPPDTLAGVQILAAPADTTGRTVGIIVDRQTGQLAAVLSVRGRSFQLADATEQQRRLATWGGLLASLARTSSPISRLQWIERTVPDDGDAIGRHLARAATAPADSRSLASYLQLVDAAGPTAPHHETLLIVAISTHRARRAIRQAGGGQRGASTVLLRELTALSQQLTSAELTVDGILTPQTLAAAVRTAFDPNSRPGLARRAAAAGDDPGCDPSNAWPLATDTTWAAYRTADVWHATYWIAHWPRTPVGADFLAPLLLGVTGMRTVSLTMQPISPTRAHREVERAVVKHSADDELRARAGFSFTARRRRAAETVTRREHELADGHADYRLSGYVTVTAASLEALDAACGEVEQAAQQSHLEIRRLYGQQDDAFTWTLPLARGLT